MKRKEKEREKKGRKLYEKKRGTNTDTCSNLLNILS